MLTLLTKLVKMAVLIWTNTMIIALTLVFYPLICLEKGLLDYQESPITLQGQLGLPAAVLFMGVPANLAGSYPRVTLFIQMAFRSFSDLYDSYR